MDIRTFLCIYIITYVSWYIINKIFGGKPDKYLRDKIYNYVEIHYGIVVSDDFKANPVKYMLADLKDTFNNMKGGKHKNE